MMTAVQKFPCSLRATTPLQLSSPSEKQKNFSKASSNMEPDIDTLKN